VINLSDIQSILNSHLHIPPAWEQLDLAALKGTVMILGATDSGKSTLARYLFRRLCEHHQRVAFLDCDIGQSILGLPTTMNLGLTTTGKADFPPRDHTAAFFVGATSPRGHMLPVVIGAHKLQERALALGAEVIVVDTTGLVGREAGGGALKQWKIELLEPTAVIGLARGRELNHILRPLQHDRRLRVYQLPVSPRVNARERETRFAYRQERFRAYFARAVTQVVSLAGLAVYNPRAAALGRLVAFQDTEGFLLDLGITEWHDSGGQTLTVKTPLEDVSRVASIRFGTTRLDPRSGEQIG